MPPFRRSAGAISRQAEQSALKRFKALCFPIIEILLGRENKLSKGVGLWQESARFSGEFEASTQALYQQDQETD